MGGMLDPSDDSGGGFAEDEKLRRAYELLTSSGGVPGIMGKAAAGLRDMSTLATPPAQVLRMPEQALGAIGEPEPTPRVADPVGFSRGVADKLRRSVEETGSVPPDIMASRTGGPMKIRLSPDDVERASKLVEANRATINDHPALAKGPTGPGRIRVGRAAHVDQPRTAVLGEAAVPAEIPEIGGSPTKSAPDSLHPAIRALLGSAGIGTADPGLERAQKAASDSRLMAALTRAGGAAIGRGQGAGYDAMQEAAEVPIRDYQQRKAEQDARTKAALDAQDRTRRYAREDLEMKGLQRTEADAVAEADPTSAESTVARDVFAGMARAVPELKALVSRPELANASAAQLKRQFPWMKEILEEQTRRRNAAGQADERKLRREEMQERRELDRQIKKQERVDKDVKELAEDVGKMGAPNFYQQAGEAQAIVDENKEDLPGFGYVGGHMPNFLVGEKGRALRRNVGQMLAEYRKGITGAGMSDAERVEYGNITGLLQSGDEDNVTDGIKQLRRAMDARVQARGAGSMPEAAAEYGRRVPTIGQVIGGGPAQSAASPDDAAAVKWARDNPGDPRAAAILKANGL